MKIYNSVPDWLFNYFSKEGLLKSALLKTNDINELKSYIQNEINRSQVV